MEKNQTCYLTTFDNPFNPDTEFDSWLDYDVEKGYYSCAYLDRIARISPSMSEIEKEREIERAIDEIIKYDFRNIYTKMYVNKNKNPHNESEDDENKTIDELLNEVVWGGIR